MTNNNPYIIAVTGTKGKTTIVRLLSHVYSNTKRPTLRVDTDGHYLNERRKSTTEDSMTLHGYGPGVCPGKHLHTLQHKKQAIAILEAVFACFTSGLGYRRHQVGIFTNVYEDHVGRRVKTRQQLAEEKAFFIFKRIAPGGTAIFNADDELICANLNKIRRNRGIKLLPVGRDFKYFDISSHLAQGGQAITFRHSFIGLITQQSFTALLDVTKVAWTFAGSYWPSVQNLAFSVAAIYHEQGDQLPAKFLQSIYRYRLDQQGGRLTLLENKKKGLRVLLDFAHDKYSLLALGELARHLADSRKTIGIIRLHPDRTDSAIADTGHVIANSFDHLIIYDKIDGRHRLAYHDPIRRVQREAGETSKLLLQAIQKAQDNHHRAYHQVIEEEAIAQAFAIAQPGDLIVHIVNDDHKQSIKLVQQYLNS